VRKLVGLEFEERKQTWISVTLTELAEERFGQEMKESAAELRQRH
jgi:hypothetical protein